MKFQKAFACAAALVTTFGGIALVTPTAAMAASSGVEAIAPVGFGGSAFGSQVKIAGPLANSGRTAYVVLGCTRRTPTTHTNSTAAIDIPDVAHIGAVETEARSRGNDVAAVWTARTRSHTAEVSLIPGLIEAGVITTQARAINDADGYHADTQFSIADLTIAGEPVTIDPAGNQVIDLPGVGSLTLGESVVRENANSSFSSITAIVLRLSDGTIVQVGHSQATIAKAINGVFRGGAHGSTVSVGGTVTSGRTANQPMPCVGTHGADRTNNVAGANIGIGTLDAVTSTVNAKQLPLPEAHASNEIAGVDIGQLSLEGIVASVNVYEDENGDVTYDTDGTTLGSIMLGDVEIEVPSPGGSVGIPGVGTLHFLEATELANGRGVQVVAVRLVLLDSTQVVLGFASATIR